MVTISGPSGQQIVVDPGHLQQQIIAYQQFAQEQALQLGTVPPSTQAMLGSTGTALVGIATSLSMLAMFIALFRLMSNAHKPMQRQQSMMMLADSSFVLVLLFGITTVVGIFASFYLHAGGL